MCFPDREDINHRPVGSFRQPREPTLRSRVIVRLDTQNRMVTKDYQKGVYEWVANPERSVDPSSGDLETSPASGSWVLARRKSWNVHRTRSLGCLVV